MMRRHPYTCTGCGHGFDAFKQLRKHWDGSCPAASPPGSPQPPSQPPPIQRQIDPTRNLWLNDSNVSHWLNADHDDSTIWIDEDDTRSVVNLISPRSSVCSANSEAHDEQNENKRDELLLTLLGVVETLSAIVLGNNQPSQSTVTRPPPISTGTTHCQVPAINEWTTVPGKQKTAAITTSHNTIEHRNIYELLDSVPSSPAKSTSSVTPMNTWSFSPPSHSRLKQQPQPPLNKVKRRPQVVINNKPESDNQVWKKTVPGNNSFAGAVKEGRKVALFSDSICNRMSKHELRNKLKCNITKKAFPGATTDDMYEHYMWPTLKKNTPDTAIIHIGANDILAKGTTDGGLTSTSIEQIAQDVIRCGEVCESVGVNTICISSVLPFKGRRAQSTINNINHQLAKLCRDKSYDFILNDNIKYDKDNTLYYGDGLHLNDVGRDILMDNFRDYLNVH